MDTASFPPDSLYARLHDAAPADTTPILIPRDLAATSSAEAGSEGAHEPGIKYVAAAMVLLVAIAGAAFILA